MPNTVPRLGVGLGLRVPHYRAIHQGQPEVDVFEIISENYLVDGGPPLRHLDRIRERYPLIMHGVSLGIGSCDDLDRDYLRRLKALAERTDSPWCSDHLCWTRAGNAHLHDLLPLPYSEEAIAWVAERAHIVQDILERPFALENLSSYVAFTSSTMSEWAFLGEVLERADCHLMLDVNNIYVSSVNHGFDPQDYLDAVPWDRVVQIHVAGHTEQDDGTILDTHAAAVREEVWALYTIAHARSGGATTILEWDEQIPDFPTTLAEAEKARRYQEAA